MRSRLSLQRGLEVSLTKEQRDNRDQLSANEAIKMAEAGRLVGIAVDTTAKVMRMLKRVEQNGALPESAIPKALR